MAVFCGLSEFEQDSKRGIRSWLFVLVRNKAADQVRQRVRQPQVSIEALAGVQEPVSQKDNPEFVFNRQFRRQLISTVIEGLGEQAPETDFKVFCMRFLDRKPPRVIAANLELEVDEVYQILYRMKLCFRLQLRGYMEFDFALDFPSKPPAPM